MATPATRADALIHARGLTKRFANLTAVDAIDFEVERGEAFGFLGPNGAAKTSTMRMIGCVSSPSAGTLRVLGIDPVQDGPRIRRGWASFHSPTHSILSCSATRTC